MTGVAEAAVRSLVLNGLTATCVVSEGSSPAPPDASDGDFYHELEIYKQLLRGEEPVEAVQEPQQIPRARRRARTPDAAPHARNDGEERRSKTLDSINSSSPVRNGSRIYKTQSRPAQYMGSFPVSGADQAARADYVSTQLRHMKETGRAVPVLVIVSLAGVKICRPEDQSVRMAHALRRISYATCESAQALFGFVAREPRGSPSRQYCHSFTTDTARQAEELNALVGDAFRMAFASQLQPTAPAHWNKEVSSSGSERSNSTMGIRAPTGIPGLIPGHYPHSNNSYPNRLSNKCDLSGAMKHHEAASPSGSEESNSPTELNCYRRLTDKPPLMKRLAMGLSGALLPQPADDSTPLVETPTSPSNRPVTMNGGYVNEAISEMDIKSIKDRDANNLTVIKDRDNIKTIKERDINNMTSMKDRDANNKFLSPSNTNSPGVPVKHIHIDSININQNPIHDKTLPSNFDSDFIKKHNNIKNSLNSLPQRSSRAASSSSGGSSCGGCSNNNLPPSTTTREEAELRLAPWFQAGIPREIALEVLSNQPVGAFMVRSSTTKLGCYALSLRVPRDFQPGGIAHYLILRTAKGYKIKGFTKEFTSLTSLITHHSVMPELLPCPLWLSRYNPGYSRSDNNSDPSRDFEDIDSDPDYNTLADFRKMMADLNV